MEQTTLRQVGEIQYSLTHKKVKHINLRVRTDGTVGVSAPMRCSKAAIDAFVAEKTPWILAAQAQVAHQEAAPCTVDKQEALALFHAVSARVFPLFSTVLGGEMPCIKVRDMKTRWGVCKMSAKQITFSLRLAQMPSAAVEYVVVHEYAHFVQPNHSKEFWAVVARILPDYKARRALLRGHFDKAHA